MLIIPEIQLQNGSVITRSTSKGGGIKHNISPQQLLSNFVSAGAKIVQIVDVDAARSQPQNNEQLVKQLIADNDIPIQVSGGIRTLSQINDWFQVGAARVVLGTVAITDSSLVIEAATRHPGGIIVHLATRNGFVTIDGWETQTAFRPEDIIIDLRMTGIAGVIHKDTDHADFEYSETLALTETLSQGVSIPVYSSGTVKSLDDLSRLRYLPNINGAIISHALISGDIDLKEALSVASQSYANPEPKSITENVPMGMHQGVRAYLAAYNSSQASRGWNLALRETVAEANPYMEILIPQIDLDIDPDSLSPRELQRCYESELDNSDIVIVILEGIENKAWTGFECGYARAKSKYIFGITSDEEIRGSSQQRFAAMCDEIIHYSPSDDFNIAHSEIAHLLAARVMLLNPGTE